MLNTVEEVQEKIAAGKNLLLAGDESLLRQLPKGSWIAGTIPYFMEKSGCLHSDSQIFVTEIPSFASAVGVREYSPAALPSICSDAPANGFSVVIMPAGSQAHLAYAQDFPTYKQAFVRPVVGWISGVDVKEIGRRQPRVFSGTGVDSDQNAVVMHVTLPPKKHADIDIVNVFQQGSGETITFLSSGFRATDCLIDGKPANLAHHIARRRVDTRLPLTANYNGTIVNVSVQSVDPGAGVVNFYAPVFAGMEYRFARQVTDYVAAFKSAVPVNGPAPTFACNCVLNYLYADLEGKKTGDVTGPITFGEIAHQLVNQTLVRLLIHDVR